MTLPAKNSSEYITAKEAAELSSYTPQAVRDWCRKYRARGCAYKHANKWYVHQPSYSQWIASN